MSCSTCKKSCQKNEVRCPLCHSPTHKVITNEVYGMIKESVRPYVHSAHFHLCDNENCEVVFCSADSEEILLTQDIIKQPLKLEGNRLGSEKTDDV